MGQFYKSCRLSKFSLIIVVCSDGHQKFSGPQVCFVARYCHTNVTNETVYVVRGTACGIASALSRMWVESLSLPLSSTKRISFV